MKLSILTVHFKDLAGLERTALSIARQERPIDIEIEWIIQDALTDGFVEFIAMSPSLYAEAEVVSESDDGIYDGMNRALQRATGDFVVFMNSGDEFAGRDVFRCFSTLPVQSADVLMGAAREVNQGVVLGTKKPRASRLALRYGMPTHHQAIFYRREVLLGVPFEPKYRIAADYDQLLRLYISGASFRCFNDLVCSFGLDGVSSRSYARAHVEQASVRVARGVSSWMTEGPLLLFKLALRAVRSALPRVYGRLRYASVR